MNDSETVSLQLLGEFGLHQSLCKNNLGLELPEGFGINLLMLRKPRNGTGSLGVIAELIDADDLLLLLEREQNLGDSRRQRGDTDTDIIPLSPPTPARLLAGHVTDSDEQSSKSNPQRDHLNHGLLLRQ